MKRASLSQADKEHLHHRLMRLGHGQRRSVVILWAWTAVLSLVVLFPTYTNHGNAIVPAAIAGLAVALYTLFHPGVRRHGQVREVPPTPPAAAPANGRRGDLRPPARLP
jgi:UDP-GlcNAc:undecaprenyl-phosphate GlcNAc-1-phosphate transferase